MIGSTSRPGGLAMPSAASDSVTLCPRVKALTSSTSWRRLPPSSSSPTRNSTWSAPIKMWCTPAATNRRTTANQPAPVPTK